MQTISKEYIEQNAMLHESNPEYGARGGEKWGQVVADIANAVKTVDILDYGAGKQSLSRCLPMFNVTSYDPAIAGINASPEPRPVVTCLDVLEHIEPKMLDAVLQDLHRVTLSALVAVVATQPAIKTLPDGRNTHLIVQDYWWWLREFKEYFEVTQMQNYGGNVLFVLARKVAQ